MRENVDFTLDDWLEYSLQDKITPASEKSSRHSFPTNALLEEYISSIASKSIREVKNLLRVFLIKSGQSKVDVLNYSYLTAREDIDELIERSEYVRRLLTPEAGAWEGITWILDLLPDFPEQAIAVIDAYDTAHYFEIPDGRIMSLMDSIAIIRSKFLHCTDGYSLLREITSRDFEYLTASLFLDDSVKVSVTPKSRDGGYEICIEEDSETHLRRTLVECKQHNRNIGVDVVRQLNGVLLENKSSNGKIVTCSKFTAPAKEFARESARIELIDGVELCHMLNSKHGSQWFRSFSRILRTAKKQLDG